MARPLNIACLQTRPLATVEAAIAEATSLAHEACGAGAQVLALPEYCGGLKSEGGLFAPPAFAEPSHPFLAEMRAMAAAKSVWVMVGSIAVNDGSGKYINRGYVVDPDGEIRSRYDKIHLFDVELANGETYKESDAVTPGGRAVLVDMAGAMTGHTICYDLRFPHLYRDLAQAGAEILAVPAAFTKTTGEAHWHVLNRARAIENGAFVVAPCAVGDVPGGGAAYGHSLIIDPWGRVLADGGTLPGVVQATIDLDHVAKIRAQIPSLTHDRPYRAAKTSRSVA